MQDKWWLKLAKYMTFIILDKSDGSHSYTTHTSIHLHSKYAGSNGLAKKTINSSLYTIFNIDTISVGVTPPLGHLELNLTDPTHYFFPFCTCVYRIAKPKLSILRHVSVDSCNCWSECHRRSHPIRDSTGVCPCSQRHTAGKCHICSEVKFTVDPLAPTFNADKCMSTVILLQQ